MAVQKVHEVRKVVEILRVHAMLNNSNQRTIRPKMHLEYEGSTPGV